MTAVQRKARADVRRYGVDCEIALARADRARADAERDSYLRTAANLADLALAIAPTAAAPQAAA